MFIRDLSLLFSVFGFLMVAAADGELQTQSGGVLMGKRAMGGLSLRRCSGIREITEGNKNPKKPYQA